MKKNRIIIFLILVLVAGYLVYSYVYKSHRDIASEKGSFTVTADEIYNEFKADQTKASAKYDDKTIDVTGTISSMDVEGNSLVIDEKMFAVFKDKLPQEIKLQSKVKIKGRFMGYDDLLDEMKMDQCVFVTE
ncbi:MULTISPECIES: OB-fold putative lipoprotein [Flavobacterium]|uniref:OB-fold putative lipoprotein n=1 Tax=Flavobacterium TaxID=237 RepID=UPI001FCA9D33|nr:MULTISPECIES: OB-fold putative lipoprotein [Flavobacterium]UOK42458.1 OB-fold putative lipoprotein [Flavobacterium enshiense]